MKKKLIIIALTLGLVMVCCGGRNGKVTPSSEGFTLFSLDSQQVSLSDYKGKVVIVDFWATWCTYCVREIPHFASLYEKYKDQGLVILGISSEDKETLEDFQKQHNVPYPILLGNKELFQKYGVQGIPHTVFYDKKGKIRKTQVGFAEDLVPVFEALIDSMVNE